MILNLRTIVLFLAFFAGSQFIERSVNAVDIPQSLRVATWNLEWFFDHQTTGNSDIARQQSAPSAAEWKWKVERVANVISQLKPDILALQEVEGRDQVYELVQELKNKHQETYRYCFIGGYDFGTEQDVAIIYRDGLVEYSRREQTQEMYESRKFYNLSKHLIARFQWGSGDAKQNLTVLVAHFRAAAEQEELRIRQARLAHEWMSEAAANGENVLILGDFNSEHSCTDTSSKSDMGVLKGLETPDTNDDFVDLNTYLPENIRQTHMGDKEFDRILASNAVIQDSPDRIDMVFSQRIIVRSDLVITGTKDTDHFNGFYKIPQNERDVSDHYPVMAEFLFK
ncbi:MAG: endonuclease/exonuclease/phosphatase family protein [Pirellulaceae bacterium]